MSGAENNHVLCLFLRLPRARLLQTLELRCDFAPSYSTNPLHQFCTLIDCLRSSTRPTFRRISKVPSSRPPEGNQFSMKNISVGPVVLGSRQPHAQLMHHLLSKSNVHMPMSPIWVAAVLLLVLHTPARKSVPHSPPCVEGEGGEGTYLRLDTPSLHESDGPCYLLPDM